MPRARMAAGVPGAPREISRRRADTAGRCRARPSTVAAIAARPSPAPRASIRAGSSAGAWRASASSSSGVAGPASRVATIDRSADTASTEPISPRARCARRATASDGRTHGQPVQAGDRGRQSQGRQGVDEWQRQGRGPLQRLAPTTAGPAGAAARRPPGHHPGDRARPGSPAAPGDPGLPVGTAGAAPSAHRRSGPATGPRPAARRERDPRSTKAMRGPDPRGSTARAARAVSRMFASLSPSARSTACRCVEDRVGRSRSASRPAARSAAAPCRIHRSMVASAVGSPRAARIRAASVRTSVSRSRIASVSRAPDRGSSSPASPSTARSLRPRSSESISRVSRSTVPGHQGAAGASSLASKARASSAQAAPGPATPEHSASARDRVV